MSTFQEISLPLIGLMLLWSIKNLIRPRGRFHIAFLWFCFWSAAAVAMALPNSTTAVARALGILRGADLVFYCGVLAGGAGFFLVYARLWKIDRQLTIVVRELALTTASSEPESPREPPRAPPGTA